MSVNLSKRMSYRQWIVFTCSCPGTQLCRGLVSAPQSLLLAGPRMLVPGHRGTKGGKLGWALRGLGAAEVCCTNGVGAPMVPSFRAPGRFPPLPLPIQVQWGCLGCLLRILSPGEQGDALCGGHEVECSSIGRDPCILWCSRTSLGKGREVSPQHQAWK